MTGHKHIGLAVTVWVSLGLAAAAQTNPSPVRKAARPTLPALNKAVADFCNRNLGRRVDNGQCAMLAVCALQAAGARQFPPYGSDDDYVWGRLVRTVKPGSNVTGNVLPGDILQYRDAEFMRKTTHPDGSWETMSSAAQHHTAVVVAVREKGRVLVILNQNTGPDTLTEAQRLTVQRETLDFGDLKQGWVKIYRPTR